VVPRDTPRCRDTPFENHCPNRSYAIECRNHLPAAPGDLCATDFFGPLPVGRGGVRYILVILDVFSKFVKLYPLRAATTRACLNRVTEHYVTQVIQSKCILSDNGTQFASPTWRKTLAELGIDVKFSPVRHPQANHSERCTK
jgi:transposase InsO family protein